MFLGVYRPSHLCPQALDTCRLLSSRLLQERLEAGLYGLYPRYKLYTAPLSALHGLVASAAVIGAIQSDRGSLSDKREFCSLLPSRFTVCLFSLFAVRQTGASQPASLIKTTLLPSAPSAIWPSRTM